MGRSMITAQDAYRVDTEAALMDYYTQGPARRFGTVQRRRNDGPRVFGYLWPLDGNMPAWQAWDMYRRVYQWTPA
jgi:hypothetical protein